MDAERQQKVQNSSSMKAFIQFLLPVSILFVTLSYYHSCYIHLLSMKLSTTAFLHGLDHFVNRKSMFLFCNAIILFITRDSGLLGIFASTNNSDDHRSPMVPNSKLLALEEKAESFECSNNYGNEFSRKRHDRRSTVGIRPYAAEQRAVLTKSVSTGLIETKRCAVEEKAVVRGNESFDCTSDFSDEFSQKRSDCREIVEIGFASAAVSGEGEGMELGSVDEEEKAVVRGDESFDCTSDFSDEFSQKRTDCREIVEIEFDSAAVSGEGEGMELGSVVEDELVEHEDIDELNRKFEAFIKKVKNEIRFEALQLVAV